MEPTHGLEDKFSTFVVHAQTVSYQILQD